MNTVVIGASGLVGYEFFRQNADKDDWTFTYRNVKIRDFICIDANDLESLERFFAELNPELVVVPAAMPNVNKCETDPDSSYRGNILPIRNILSTMKKFSAKKIVFFSTDYIFDGQHGPYFEDSIPNPLNVYGKHKLECEQLIRSSSLEYLIIRTTGIFGWEKQRKNFMYRVIDTLSAGKSLDIPNDQFANPTYVRDLVSAVMQLLKLGCSGIFNISGPEIMDRETFARKIAAFYGLDLSLVVGHPTSYFRDVANRPLKSGFKLNKLDTLGIKTKTVEDSLADMQKRKTADDVY